MKTAGAISREPCETFRSLSASRPYSPRAMSGPAEPSARLPDGAGNTSSSKLMRSTSPGGWLCWAGAGGLAGGPSPSDLKALACDATESRGGTRTGFSKAAEQAVFSEDADFLGSKGRGAGVGAFLPPLGLSAAGPPPRLSRLMLRMRPGFGFFGNSGLVTGLLPASFGGDWGAGAPLSLLAVQESHSPEALLAVGLGASEGFPEETAGLGGTVRGTISGFLGSPKLSVFGWPSSALILETTVLRLCSAFIMFITAWPSGWLVPSHRGGGRLGAASACAAMGLLRESCSLTWESRATGLRLLFDLGFGTGHLGALEFCGQFCSSEISKTIRGSSFVGGCLAETAGEGCRGFRGACRADKTKMNRSCNVTMSTKRDAQTFKYTYRITRDFGFLL